MLNYSVLSDVEFEYLCQDIMQRKLGVRLHRFSEGRDDGIDLTDNVSTKNIVVQAKHYYNSTPSALISNLKKEIEKVKRLDPDCYYICCSKALTPASIEKIYNMFSDYMLSTENIITLTDIDDFLVNPRNEDILHKHYKLWIDSTGILQEVLNNKVFIDCEVLLANIQENSRLFVQTYAYDQALECLKKNRSLFITGAPGVGKTVTSKMLVLYYAANGYRVRYSTNVSNLSELKNSLSRDPKTKEIILIDDCFGQAYFNMRDGQDTELLSLIHYVNLSKNKLLILNSRVTILNEVKERKPELLRCFEDGQCKVHVLDMSEMSVIEKAKILYNHIVFSGMDKRYYDEIIKNARYFGIVKHKNYCPRIIEYVCNPHRYRGVDPSLYYSFVMHQLDNPREMWNDEYERKISKVDRYFLETLYSLSDMPVDEKLVRHCFYQRIADEPDVDTSIDQYGASLSRLTDGFMKIVAGRNAKMLSMINPSVNDFLDGWFENNAVEKEKLKTKSRNIMQKMRLLNEQEFEDLAQMLVEENRLDELDFISDDQRRAFVACYVGKYNIVNPNMKNDITLYLCDHSPLVINSGHVVSSYTILKRLLTPYLIDFYELKEFLYDDTGLCELFVGLSYENMVDIVLLIDGLYTGERRRAFIECVSGVLNDKVNLHYNYIDAYDYDYYIYVDSAIQSATYILPDGDTYFDYGDAVGSVENEIRDVIESSIKDVLDMLPTDILSYYDILGNMSLEIERADELVDDYLNNDEDEDDGYGDDEEDMSEDDEIRLMFDRDLAV